MLYPFPAVDTPFKACFPLVRPISRSIHTVALHGRQTSTSSKPGHPLRIPLFKPFPPIHAHIHHHTKKRPQEAEKHAPCSRYPFEIEHPVPLIKHPSPEMFAQCSPDVLSFTFCFSLPIPPFHSLTLSHPTSSDCVLNIPFMNILFFPP